MSDKRSDSSFLDRWSARKRQAEQQAPMSSPTDTLDDSDTVVHGAAFEQADLSSSLDRAANSQADLSPTDAESPDEHQVSSQLEVQEPVEPPLLTDDDMPPIESLSSESDLSGFFNKGVSATLRKAALRHVFQQPVFNVRDGLNDYDGDYTVFEPLGDTVTSDMKWHIARKERERLEAEALELEEQQRLALEQEALENQEPQAETAEAHETVEEDTVPSEEEQDTAIAIDDAADEATQSAQAPILDQHTLLISPEPALGDTSSTVPLPKRVAGKLRRTDQRNSQTESHSDNNTLQLADAGQGKNENAQDYEE